MRRALEIDPNPAKWALAVGAREFHALSLQKLFGRYYAEKRVRMFSVNADDSAKSAIGRV